MRHTALSELNLFQITPIEDTDGVLVIVQVDRSKRTVMQQIILINSEENPDWFWIRERSRECYPAWHAKNCILCLEGRECA